MSRSLFFNLEPLAFDSFYLLSDSYIDYYTHEIFDLNDILIDRRISPFKFFFANFNIDTPAILNKTKSLKRLHGQTIFSKLTPYLFRHGKKANATKIVSNTLFKLLQEFKSGNNNNFNKRSSWSSLYFILLFLTSDMQANFMNLHIFSKSLKLNLFYNVKLRQNEVTNTTDVNLKDIWGISLKKFRYLFSFYVYKVDKNIYKNSRGKSGKFTFVWKYVAPYKRNLLINHWLMKEVRISPGKTLQERVDYVLGNFIVSPEKTWIWKINKFSMNYVYYNLRNSLAETCRTSMR